MPPLRVIVRLVAHAWRRHAPLMLLVLAGAGVEAAPPANDTWTGRTTITSLPFTDTLNVSEATKGTEEPWVQCAPYPGSLTSTVWYSYTTGPTREYVSLSGVGTNFQTVLTAMRGTPGAFQVVAESCTNNSGDQSHVRGVRLEPNTEYSILAQCKPAMGDPPERSLTLTVEVAPVHQVTKTEDTLDGTCDADCSLREAVAAHNAAPGVVLIPAGEYRLTREDAAGVDDDANASGDIDLSWGGAVYGAGTDLTLIDADLIGRAFDFRPVTGAYPTGAVLDLTIANGLADDGGGVRQPTRSYGVLSRVRVRDSFATHAGGAAWPGGFSEIRECEFLNNRSPRGGALYLPGAAAPWILDSTFAGNDATYGGAVLATGDAHFRMRNVTLSGNSALRGGALYLSGYGWLSGVTAVGNRAPTGGGGVLYVHQGDYGFQNIDNSLFALNDGGATGDCVTTNVYPNTLRGGYNLLGNWAGGNCVFSAPTTGNLFDVDARVSPVLASNGGTLPTHALLPGSPAIDSGPPGCTDIGDFFPQTLLADQRGRSRATDGNGDGMAACDRGAYERVRVKGDFDGDRGTDLLLRSLSTNGHVAWLMNGTSRSAEALVTPDPPGGSWRVAGVDDFTGDDLDDLVLHDTAGGSVEFWRLGGGSGTERQGDPIPIANAPALDPNWALAATADFNRDGRADLVWRNEVTQKLAIWTLNGSEVAGTLVPTPDQAVDANWAVVAALDWDGNGTTDFLWYNSTTGKIVQWLMDDAVQRTAGRFTTPANAGDNNWKVVAGGDYGLGPSGQPGTADVVWRNSTSGRLVVWHMGWDGVRTAGVFTTPDAPDVPLDWDVVGPR